MILWVKKNWKGKNMSNTFIECFLTTKNGKQTFIGYGMDEREARVRAFNRAKKLNPEVSMDDMKDPKFRKKQGKGKNVPKHLKDKLKKDKPKDDEEQKTKSRKKF
jgi:hypothetical protein